MNAATRRLAAYLIVTFVFLGVLVRIEHLNNQREQDRREADARICAAQVENRNAIRTLVEVATAPDSPFAGDDPARAEAILMFRNQALDGLPPIKCERL